MLRHTLVLATLFGCHGADETNAQLAGLRADIQTLQRTQLAANRSVWELQLEEALALARAVRSQTKMQELMEMALSGRQFSPPELIAMQAGVQLHGREAIPGTRESLRSRVIHRVASLKRLGAAIAGPTGIGERCAAALDRLIPPEEPGEDGHATRIEATASECGTVLGE